MSVNLSHKVCPFPYGNEGTEEVVLLECVRCGLIVRKRLAHSTSNTEIMTRHFKGWKARGYRNQKRTLCPECADDKPTKHYESQTTPGCVSRRNVRRSATSAPRHPSR